MTTVYILWLRQIKRYLRSKSRIIGSLGQPLLFFLAFGFGFGPIFQKAGGGNYVQFLAPGIISMSIIFTAIFSGIEMIWDRQFGFLKETFVAPVPRLHIVIGRTLGGATVAFLQGLLVFLLILVVGFKFTSFASLPLALVVMFLIALLFTAIGTAIASVLEDMHGFLMIINFLIMPLFFFSGAMFPLAGLPKVIVIISSVNPLSYGVDALRGLLINNSAHFGIALDMTVLVLCCCVAVAIASYLFSKIKL